MPKRREHQICPSGGSIGRRFGVDLELASDLSRRIGVSEMAEYWEKVLCRFSTGREWDWHGLMRADT
jgi:hypothetical protein